MRLPTNSNTVTDEQRYANAEALVKQWEAEADASHPARGKILKKCAEELSFVLHAREGVTCIVPESPPIYCRSLSYVP